MSGILKVCSWLVCGKNVRNNSGNSYIVGVDKIMMSPVISLISPGQQSCSEQFALLDKVLILCAGSGIRD